MKCYRNYMRERTGTAYQILFWFFAQGVLTIFQLQNMKMIGRKIIQMRTLALSITVATV